MSNQMIEACPIPVPAIKDIRKLIETSEFPFESSTFEECFQTGIGSSSYDVSAKKSKIATLVTPKRMNQVLKKTPTIPNDVAQKMTNALQDFLPRAISAMVEESMIEEVTVWLQRSPSRLCKAITPMARKKLYSYIQEIYRAELEEKLECMIRKTFPHLLECGVEKVVQKTVKESLQQYNLAESQRR